MAETIVSVVVKTKGQEKLEQLKRGLDATTKKLDKLKAGLSGKIQTAFQRIGQAGIKAGNKIKRGFDTAAKGAGKLLNKVNNLRGTLLGLGVGAGLAKAFGDASALESTEARAGLLVKRFEQLDGIQKVAAQSAEKFRLTQTNTLTDLVDLGSRLGATGTSLEDIQTIYEGFNTLLAVNKVESAQAASAQLQLNQALGAGVLNGEEFNAINDATPQLLDAVAKKLNVERGELKKLASEGKITREVLIAAFADINESAGGDLEGTFTGAFGATREFNAALQEFSTIVGQELLPVITPLIQGATELLKLFGQLPKPVRTVAVAVAAIGTAALVAAPAIAAIVTAFKAVGIVAVIAGAKIALIVAAIAGIGAALIALQDKWEPFRRATAAVAAFFTGVVNSFKEQFAGTTKSWADNSKKFSDFFVGIWNAIAGFFKGIGEKLQGIWNGVTNFFNEKLGFVVDFFEGVWNGILQFFSGIVNKLASQWQTFVEFVVNSLVPLGNVFKLFGVNIGEAVANGLSSGFKALSAPRLSVKRPPKKRGGGDKDKNRDLDFDFDGDGNGTDTGGGRGSGDEALRILEQQMEAGMEINKDLDRRIKLLQTQNQFDKQILQNSFDLEDQIQTINRTAAPLQREGLITKAGVESDLKDLEVLKEAAADFGQSFGEEVAGKLPEINKELTQTQELLGNAFGVITNGIQSGIQGLIDGSKELNDVLKDILSNLGNLALQFAFNSLGKGLNIPGFAEGGRPEVGKPAIVGEKGPELFIPDTAGTVIPNDQAFDDARGALVDVSSRPVDVAEEAEAFAVAASALARNSQTISSRSEREIERTFQEQMATAGSQSTMTVKVDSRVINNEEFVTLEQFSKGVAQSAKAAEANVFAKMKNRPSVRRSLGMA